MSLPAPGGAAPSSHPVASAPPPGGVIDLRSDTVTRPTPAMRAAIAAAVVGDDLYREDPTVQALEQQIAALVGKEAALLVPSGTMANQLGLRLHVQPGDDVLVSDGAHIKWYESGAAAALAGVQLVTVGQGGFFSVAELRAAYHAERTDHAYAPMHLLCLEDTHNRGGGKVWPRGELQAVCAAAGELGLRLHLDGARLWNAAVALGTAPSVLAAPFDTVAVCLSKGLGAPAGSLLCGSRRDIERARRFRRMYGGSMRQAGILAAAGLYALDHHYALLPIDHEHARLLAQGLTGLAHVEVTAPETNIVLFDLHPPLPEAEVVVAALAAHGVLCGAFGPRRIRLVTHLDVDRAACSQAVARLRQVLCGL
ncbi:MAG TPA: threonine aldolase family protein [Pseudomonadota bacterium]|nr:threonine aldolase family protein [Pseudomonadota bacterium]